MKKILMASGVSAIALAFMSDACETVTVKGEDGKALRINKSDYDANPDNWEKFGDEEDDAKLQPVPGQVQLPDADTPPLAAPSAPHFGTDQENAPAPIDPLKNAVAPTAHGENARLVMKRGSGKKTRYHVVDGTGNDIQMDGIDPAGYETEEGAWKAIMDLPR